MYSVVLLVAMTSGGEAPDWGRGGCRGGWGGCYGGGWGGCRGWGGCYGGWGGCYGGGWGGCYGGCYGGGYSYGCYGGYSYGCYGGGYGGCYGGGYVASYPVVSYGCCGGGVVYGAPVTGGGKVITNGTGGKKNGKNGKNGSGDEAASNEKLKPGTALNAEEQKWLKEMVTAEKDQAEKKKIEDDFKKDSHVGRKATYEVFKKMKSGGDEQVSVRPAPATVYVKVAPNTRLTVDGEATYSASMVRTFETPNLQPGKTYGYNFKAKFTRNGKPVTVNRYVRVEAGKKVAVDMTREVVAVASR